MYICINHWYLYIDTKLMYIIYTTYNVILTNTLKIKYKKNYFVNLVFIFNIIKLEF